MSDGDILQQVAGHQAFAPAIPDDAKLTATLAANVPAQSTGTLVLLSDAITALTALRASYNDLLAKLKAAGLMVPD